MARNHKCSPASSQSQLQTPAPISVIIPSYNCEAYIGEAIKSALSQEPPPLEVIVADDGSTDRTSDVVQAFGEPVRYHRLPGSRNGAAAARNAAIELSHGKYLALLDADDIWLPGKLAAQMRVLDNNPDVSLCATRFSVWHPTEHGQWPKQGATSANSQTPNQGPDPIDPSKTGWLYTSLLLRTLLWTSTVVLRRDLLDELGGFREDLKLAQDYDLWLRASRHTRIVTLATPYALYRKRPDSTTANWAPVNYELCAVRSALARWGREGPNGDIVSKRLLRRRIGTLHFNMAYNQYHTGHPASAMIAAAKCAMYRPTFSKAWTYVALSLLALPRRTLSRFPIFRHTS